MPVFASARGARHRHWRDLTLAARLPALCDWYHGEVGQRLWCCEQQVLEQTLPSLFGYHLMSLGICQDLPLAAASPIRHCFTVSPQVNRGVCAQLHQLPLAADSVDVAILHHCLDYSEDPHQLLRETARVLIPWGHVLVFGFERWSALGIAQQLRHGLCPDPVVSHRFMSASRMHDWLRLLDFEVLSTRHITFVPPQLGEPLAGRLLWLEALGQRARLPWGSVWFTLARKTVAGVHPLSASRQRIPLRNPLAALAPRPLAPSVDHPRGDD